MKWYYVVLIVIALVAPTAVFVWGIWSGFNPNPEFNIDSLQSLGFEVIDGYLIDSSNVIFISDAGTFIQFAQDCNVKTVFLSSHSVFFGYNGTIYEYSW